MTTYGVTASGFVPKTVEILIAEISAGLQAKWGSSINLDSDSDIGQLVGIMSERLGELWDVAQAVDANFDPARATDLALDAVAAITGTTRDPATPSKVTGTLTGTAATVVQAGKQASVVATGVKFATDALATLAALPAWLINHVYVLGDRVANGGNAYQAITPGTSAGAGGPTTTAADITDNTVHWRYLGAGGAAVDVGMTAILTGPLPALSGTLTVIETPVAGWSNVINVLDAAVGTNVEQNAALRVKREAELAAEGGAVPDAIRADLLKVSGVTACKVFVNFTDLTNASGLPPHSIEALVQGGTDAAVRAGLWASLGGGIRPYGNTIGTLTDSSGNLQEVDFSRPVLEPIYVILHVTYDAALYPADGDAQVKAAVLAFGNAYAVGKDVVASGLGAQAFAVAGVLDVTATYIGLAPAPGASTTIVVTDHQLATFDTSRISIVSVAGTP